MNIQARWNLQHGIPENKSNECTNYTIESPLDSYIYYRMRYKNDFESRKENEQQEKAVQEYIKEILDSELEKCLKSLL